MFILKKLFKRENVKIKPTVMKIFKKSKFKKKIKQL